MRKAVRFAIGSAALAMGIAVAAAANAQVRFEGSFPLPHGRISVGVGGPAFSVGTGVPGGFVVYEDPDYGYGFVYQDQWIPCAQYGSRWVIVGRPVFFGRRESRAFRPFEGGRSGFDRRDRFASRGFGREERRFRDNRSFGREDRRFRDSRSDGRRNRDSRDGNSRWNR